MLLAENYLTTSDGIRLFFRKVGDGPDTVLIPNGIYLFDDFERLADGRTLVFYDLRNRGHPDRVDDPAKLAGGILNDVDDLEAVRRHFQIDKLDVIGHSYMGLMVILHAMKYPAHVNRIVQIGAMPAFYGKQYPVHLTNTDGTLADVFAKIAQLQKERQSEDAVELCKQFWDLLRVIYVADAADAGKIKWSRCDVPNELNFMHYWTSTILPSVENLRLAPEKIAEVKAPVLAIHGRKDRSSPYGGGREWALMLPDARLVTVDNAAHAPWIEAPETTFAAIDAFLDGEWPLDAEKVTSLDPGPGAVKEY